MEFLPEGEGLGTYQVIARITEVIASYKHSDDLPVLLEVYCLKRTENKQGQAGNSQRGSSPHTREFKLFLAQQDIGLSPTISVGGALRVLLSVSSMTRKGWEIGK